jgi:DNA-binding transcriptional MerR regulator
MPITRTYTMDEVEHQSGFERRTIAYYVQKRLLPKVGRRGPRTRYPQTFLDRLLFVKMIREKQDHGEIGNLSLKDIRDILERVRPETIADMVKGDEPLPVVDIGASPHPVADDQQPQVVDSGASPAPAVDAEPPKPFVQRVNPRYAGSIGLNGSAVKRMEVLDTMRVATVQPAFDPEASGEFYEVVIDDPGEAPNGISQTAPNEVHHMADSPSVTPQPAAQEPAEPEAVQRPLHYEKAAGDTPPAAADENGEAVDHNGFDAIDPQERLGWSLARLQRVLNVPRRNRGTTESWHRARITPELTISARNLTDNDAHLLDAVARTLKKMLWEAWEE